MKTSKTLDNGWVVKLDIKGLDPHDREDTEINQARFDELTGRCIYGFDDAEEEEWEDYECFGGRGLDFFCGPEVRYDRDPKTYLSDNVDCYVQLNELFGEKVDIGTSENMHRLIRSEMPEGTTFEQAKEYLDKTLSDAGCHRCE